MNSIVITNYKYKLKYPYQITDTGKIYSPCVDRFLNTTIDRYGYEKVALVSNDNKRHRYSVHRLVLENFCPIGNMKNLQVNHIDGNKLNNNLSNLEWVTPHENTKHAFAIGLKTQKGEANNAAKYSEEIILQVIEMFQQGYTGAEIDRHFGFCADYANSIRRKERWSYLTKDIKF